VEGLGESIRRRVGTIPDDAVRAQRGAEPGFETLGKVGPAGAPFVSLEVPEFKSVGEANGEGNGGRTRAKSSLLSASK
jgi:hypothetical protein